MESVFKAVFGATFLGLIISLRVVAQRLKQRPDGRINQMSHEVPALRVIRPVLGLIFYAFLLDWLAPGTRFEWAVQAVPSPVRWLGAAGCLGAILIVRASLEAMGRHYRGGVGLWDDHELVVAGPYRYVRHPIYTAFVAIMLSVWALSASWVVGGAGLLLTLSIPLIRVRIEERQLGGRFGSRYSEYADATPRFLPRILWPTKRGGSVGPR